MFSFRSSLIPTFRSQFKASTATFTPSCRRIATLQTYSNTAQTIIQSSSNDFHQFHKRHFTTQFSTETTIAREEQLTEEEESKINNILSQAKSCETEGIKLIQRYHDNVKYNELKPIGAYLEKCFKSRWTNNKIIQQLSDIFIQRLQTLQHAQSANVAHAFYWFVLLKFVPNSLCHSVDNYLVNLSSHITTDQLGRFSHSFTTAIENQKLANSAHNLHEVAHYQLSSELSKLFADRISFLLNQRQSTESIEHTSSNQPDSSWKSKLYLVANPAQLFAILYQHNVSIDNLTTGEILLIFKKLDSFKGDRIKHHVVQKYKFQQLLSRTTQLIPDDSKQGKDSFTTLQLIDILYYCIETIGPYVGHIHSKCHSLNAFLVTIYRYFSTVDYKTFDLNHTIRLIAFSANYPEYSQTVSTALFQHLFSITQQFEILPLQSLRSASHAMSKLYQPSMISITITLLNTFRNELQKEENTKLKLTFEDLKSILLLSSYCHFNLSQSIKYRLLESIQLQMTQTTGKGSIATKPSVRKNSGIM